MGAKIGTGNVAFRLGSATPAKLCVGSAAAWPFSFNENNLTLVYDTAANAANNGGANTLTVSVPLNGSVDCTVDWGDGLSDAYTTTGFKSHTYAAAGIYVVQISGTMTTFSHGTAGGVAELVRCLSFGETGLTSLANGFRNCGNFIQCPSRLPTGVTTLASCFQSCTFFNDSRVGLWNTAAVTNMSAAFRNAIDFNQDISGWNTAAVTNMANMFFSAVSFSRDISAWDIRNVTTMASMFASAGSAWGTANYDAALLAWSARSTPQSSVSANFGTNQYSAGAAAAARGVLTGAYNWTITDGGQA